MSGRSTGFDRYATVCFVLFATGCTSVTLTADTVKNPVLFGPVRALGSHPPSDTVRISEFVSNAEKVLSAIPTGAQSAMALADSSSLTRMASDVQEATDDKDDRSIVITEINCGAYFLFPLLYIRDRTWCKATGTLFASPLPPIPVLIPKRRPKKSFRSSHLSP